MEYIPFGRNGVKVSRMCVGAMTFGGQSDEATSNEIIRLCLEAGVNFFDTAEVYGGGASETLLGRALKDVRQNVVITSKVRGPVGPGPNQAGLSRLRIIEGVEQSLKRLGTDYLDIYLLHQPDYETPFEETLAAMDGLVRSGKVRYIGCSNFAAWQIVQAQWIADRRNMVPLSVAQPMYNLLARGMEQELVPACRELGVGIMVYNPIAGGFLSGKYTSRDVQKGTRFDLIGFYRDRYWHDEYFDAVAELTGIASDAGLPLLDFSIQWCLQQPGVHAAIMGASKVEQIRQTLKVFEKSSAEMRLPAEALAACDTVWQKTRGLAPRYNR